MYIDAKEIILKIRTLKEETQTEFADRIGVKKMTVSRWERGIRTPTIKQLNEVLEKSGVLMTWKLGPN